MALPTLSKIWDVDPNVAGGTSVSALADHQADWFAIKEALVGAGNITNPWIVSSSSNSVSISLGDLWLAPANIVFGAGVHSWIVLQDPTGDYQICIDLDNAAPSLADLVWSPTGVFTGGTTSARPTAVDEHVLFDSQNWLGNNLNVHTAKVHVGVSTDGEATFIAVNSAGVTHALWILCELDDAPTGLGDRTFIHVDFATAVERGLISRMTLDTRNFMDEGGALINPRLSVEALSTSGVVSAFNTDQTAASSDSAAFPIGPVGVWGINATPERGKKGNIPDLFWGLEVNNTGDQFPDVAFPNPLFSLTQFGDIIVAWDQLTAVQVT